MCGSSTSSDENSATSVPVSGVPSQTRTDHCVVVAMLADEVAKMISAISSLIGKAAAGSVYDAAAISFSAIPASRMNEPPEKSASVCVAIWLHPLGDPPWPPQG